MNQANENFGLVGSRRRAMLAVPDHPMHHDMLHATEKAAIAAVTATFEQHLATMRQTEPGRFQRFVSGHAEVRATLSSSLVRRLPEVRAGLQHVLKRAARLQRPAVAADLADSYCVSVVDPARLPNVLKMLDADSRCILDNGAYAAFRRGHTPASATSYWDWAMPILAAVPQ